MSIYNAGLYLNHDKDLTEEDIQIWHFGPGDVGTKFKLSTGWFFEAHPPHPSIPTLGDIKFDLNYLYSTYGHIAPTVVWLVSECE